MLERNLEKLAFQWYPYVEFETKPNGEIRVRGPMGNILESLVSRYNFTYQARVPDDNTWGILSENGSATGMIGMLLRNESDWATNPFGHNYERFRLLSYSSEFMMQDLIILAGRTFGFTENYFGLFQAFSPNVWLCVALLMLTIPIVLAIGWISDPNDVNQAKKSVSDVVIFYGRSLLNLVKSTLFESMSDHELPQRNSSKLLMAVWLIMIFFTMTIFVGEIKASLVVKSEPIKIKNVEDVAKNPKILPIFWYGTGYHRFFKSASVDIYKTIHNRAKEGNGIRTGAELYSEQSFRKVLQGRAVYINEKSSIMYFLGQYCEQLQSYPGEFYFVEQPVYTQGYSMLLRKTLHPALKKLINKTIRQLQETGNIEKWMNDAMSLYFSCSIAGGTKKKKDEPVVFALAFSWIKGNLVSYGVGLGAALIVLNAEIFPQLCVKRRHLQV